MEQDFEQSMRDSLEGASLDDLAPDFDKEGEWDRLNQRLHPKRRTVIPFMWSHAAAVLVGVTIGWFLLKGTGKQVVESSAQVAVAPAPIQSQPAPATVVQHDTVIKQVATAARQTAAAQPALVKTITVVQHDTVQVLVQNSTPAAQATDTPVNTTIKSAEAVATVRKPRPQAVHLLDVESGAKSMLISPEYADMPHGFLNTLQRVIFSQNAMVNNDEQSADKPYVARHILTK